MSDSQPAASPRYWNAPRLLVAVALVAVVAGVAYYGWQQNNVRGGGPVVGNFRGGFAMAGQSGGSHFNLDDLQISKEKIRSGGPPKDGIPSLTDPQMLPVSEADFLSDQDRVVAVVASGQARAYPVRILSYHECVNDTIADQPIAGIYCPLCDSFSVVDRTLDGKTFEFGISGLLANSNVLLYDRTDQALWSQVRLTAVSGPHAGKSLRHLDGWSIEPFAQFKADHPDGQVMSINTSHRRNYARDPYAGYFRNDALMFPAEPSDDRMPKKSPVIGVLFSDGRTIAYPIASITSELRDDEVMLKHDSDTGAVHIESIPDDAAAIYTFWFAWYAYHPQTQVFGD